MEYVRDPATGLLTAWNGYNGTPERRRQFGHARGVNPILMTAQPTTPDFGDLYMQDAAGLVGRAKAQYEATDIVLDFSVGYFQDGAGKFGHRPETVFGANWQYTRTDAQLAYADTFDGALIGHATGVPRWTDKGLLVEEATSNTLPRSGTAGVVPGVIGSGGALPTGWSIGNAPAGVTTTVLRAETRKGVDGVVIRVQGTSAAGGTVFLEPTPMVTGSYPAAASGQTWAGSLYTQIDDGSFANFVGGAGGIDVSGHNAAGGGSFVENGIIGAANTQTTTTFARRYTVRTFANALTLSARVYMSLPIPNGATVDVTFFMGFGQLEQKAFPTSYTPTAGAAATRALDVPSLAVTLPAAYTWMAEGFYNAQLAGTFPGLMTSTGGSANNVGLFISTSNGSIGANMSAGGYNATAAGTVSAGQTAKAAFRAANNDARVAGNGVLASGSGVFTPATGAATVFFGGGQGGAYPWNGPVRRAIIRQRAMSDAELQAWTA